ncbi:hypothetical protein SEA27A368_17790 [Salmonella enterica]|nr:hypothetical protein SEA27A368_17790 [Salmonella enterica]CAH2820231.1 hypothetical protein SENBN720500_15080 [Salmonella enterica subsp. enterica]
MSATLRLKLLTIDEFCYCYMEQQRTQLKGRGRPLHYTEMAQIATYSPSAQGDRNMNEHKAMLTLPIALSC